MSENQQLTPPAPPVVYAQNSSKAVVSLVFGILGITPIPLIGGIVALVTGYPARKEIRESGGRLTGDGLALAGIILGWISIGIGLLYGCFWVLWFYMAMNSGLFNSLLNSY